MPNTREKLIELLKDFDGTCVCGLMCDECRWHGEGECGVLARADHLIANGVTVQGDKDINVPTKWISVKDRLPERSETVLCYWKNNIKTLKYWRTSGQFEYCGRPMNVTHWMPLPGTEGLE